MPYDNPLAIKLLSSKPIYNGNETPIEFMKKINAYENNIKKEKYEIVLQFINTWLYKYNKNITSLLKFKKISEDIILSDEKYNKMIVNKNIDIVQKLGILFDDNDDESDKESVTCSNKEEEKEDDDSIDKIKEETIIIFTRKILKAIGYNFTYKIINDKRYYSIY